MGLFDRIKKKKPALRYTVLVRDGLNVELMVSPHIYGVASDLGVDLDLKSTDATRILALYADMMYCAAQSLWELSNKEETAPFSRADFHTFLIDNPKEFRRAADWLTLAVASMVEGLSAAVGDIINKPDKAKKRR